MVKEKTDKYTSVDIQNEVFKTMALHILRQITKYLEQTPFITLMGRDNRHNEAVFCLHWVDHETKNL